jgi:hypothetical protein
MALEFRGYRSAAGTTNPVNLPTTGLVGGTGTIAEAGDLLLVVHGLGGVGGTDRAMSVAGSGLTFTEELDVFVDGGTEVNAALSWAIASSTPPASLQINGLSSNYGSGGFLLVFRGHDATTPMDVPPVYANSTTYNTPNPGSIAPVTAGAIVIAMGIFAEYFAHGYEFTGPPSGYSNYAAVHAASNQRDIVLAIATKVWTSGTEDPGTFSTSGENASNSWAAFTVAVRPAAGGGPVGGLTKVWNGSAWVEKSVKAWNGSAWLEKPVKIWNGAAWVLS